MAAAGISAAQPHSDTGNPGPAAAENSGSGASIKDSLVRRMRSLLRTLRHPFPATVRHSAVLEVLSPLDGTLFPLDIRSPEFRWDGPVPEDGTWAIRISFKGSTYTVNALSDETAWTPSASVWEAVRAHSIETPATFSVSASGAGKARAEASVGFFTSRDPVGAPLFFRAVPSGRTFPEEKEYVKVKWKLGWVSSYSAPIVVMKKQSLCFNCHSASADGRTFGFDYNSDSNDMSSYLLFRDPGKTVSFSPENVFDWNDFRRGDNVHPFQANSSAISPDGRVIATDGRGLGLVAPNCPDLIQYTFPMRGIIVYRTIEDPAIKALPGGDDEGFIHYPTSWSPDGKYIYFFGAPVPAEFNKRNLATLKGEDTTEGRKLGWRELDKLYPIRYGVYRIPFSGGKGGRAEPVRGASNNGMSNYFPRVSPDGKWVVFTASANGAMLVREDSDLYIVPAAGGKARKLRSSGPRADSWHSWSPNGRWLAFASKSYGARTDIVLTHIDAAGQDSPPVVLTQMRDEDGLSANLPEFFNIRPGQLEKIIPRLN